MLAPHGRKGFPSLAEYMSGRPDKAEVSVEDAFDQWAAALGAV